MTRRREHRGHGLTTDGAPDQQAELKEVRIEEKTLDENKGVGVKEETSTYFIHWQTYWRMFGSAAPELVRVKGIGGHVLDYRPGGPGIWSDTAPR